MAKFDFKLEGVLRHRKNLERERQRELAVVQAQLRQLENQLRQLDLEVQQASGDLRQNRLVGRLDLNFLAAHRRFVAAMQKKGMTLVQRMAVVRKQVEEARNALAQAAIQRKAIEKLREKQHQRWQDELNRKQAEEIDEIGMQLTCRRLSEEATEAAATFERKSEAAL
jgi:flagellar export protein FliJ